MLSFSNFGSVKHPSVDKVRRAVALLHEREPALQVDGEMQADTAVVERILTKAYPFAKLRSAANVLIFPDLDAANIAYKLLNRIGGAEAIGPILVGMAQPVHILQRGAEVNDIVNMAVIAAVGALEPGRRPRPSAPPRPEPDEHSRPAPPPFPSRAAPPARWFPCNRPTRAPAPRSPDPLPPRPPRA